MPITQQRMIDLIQAADAFATAGRKNAEVLRRTLESIQRGKPAEQALQEIEWITDWESQVEDHARHWTNLLLERKWFQKFGAANIRRAAAQREALGRTPKDPGGPRYVNDLVDLKGPRASAIQQATITPPLVRALGPADYAKIEKKMDHSGVDFDTAAAQLGYELPGPLDSDALEGVVD